jgi:hypothetical protein
MSVQLMLSEQEIARELDRALEQDDLVTYGLLLFCSGQGIAVIRCLGGCGVVLPFVEPFGLHCSQRCEDTTARLRRGERRAA